MASGSGRIAMTVLGRGLRRRCPQCGEGRLFVSWYTLVPECSQCGLPFTANEGNTWAFMYLGTGFLTGLILVAMLLCRPAYVWLGQIGVVSAAVVLIIGTLPVRKGLAIAADYLITLRSKENDGVSLREDGDPHD